jgi:hypothetical protein
MSFIARRLVAFSTALIVLAAGAGSALAQKKYDIGATDTEIKIGNIMPYSGPLSAYALIGRTEAAFFTKINAEGGVNGRKINFITYDDAFSPPKTVEQARKLVESDEVLLIFQSLGTPTNNAIRQYMNLKKVPQLFVATGATQFGDRKSFPWTMGWQPTYQTEGRIYAKYILQNLPQGKIGILYQNDDSGRDYIKGLKDGLGAEAAKRMIVAELPPRRLSTRRLLRSKLRAPTFFSTRAPRSSPLRRSGRRLRSGGSRFSSSPVFPTRWAPCSSPPDLRTPRGFCRPTISRTPQTQPGRTIPRSRSGLRSWTSIFPREIRQARSVFMAI